MRDDHLIVEKIDLSLERRQVALVAAVALVLLGGVFALGVLVGRQLATAALAGPRAVAPGDLAALDAQKDDPQLPVKAASAVPFPAPASVPASPSRIDAAGTPASAAAAPRAGASPGASAPQGAASASAGSAGSAAKDSAADGDEDVPAHKGTLVVPPAKVATIAQPKPAARPASVLPLALPPKQLGAFTVQLGASQDRSEAQRLQERAKAAGLRPYLVEANLGAKGIWYRVRVGAFASREAAERYRKDVERELRGSAIVMPSH